MANYEAVWRTNYFEVKDEASFKKFIARCGAEFWQSNDKTMVACGGYSSLPQFLLPVEPGATIFDEKEDEEIDFVTELQKHLAEGEIAVIMEIGNEKLRYLNGFAIAVSSNGEVKTISLDDIYKQAMELKNEGVSRCEG